MKQKWTFIVFFLTLTLFFSVSCGHDTEHTAQEENTLCEAALASGYDKPPAWASAFSLKPSTQHQTSSDPASYAEAEDTGGDLLTACQTFGDISKLTVTAKANGGVAYDIYSYTENKKNTIWLFLPCTADLSRITFYAEHQTGHMTGPYQVDFSGNKTSSGRVSGKTYTIAAMQSELPTLYLQIDESSGSISAMNNSPDHSVYCYGDMLLSVTDKLAAERGWKTSYISREGDSSSPGTMNIRGRGNWTWNQKKKPYQFKMEKKLDLLGMGEAKKWLLLANVMDASLLRNQLFYNLAADMGLAGTTKIEPVDLFINGKYAGSYSLCEKVEVGPTRVDIDENKDFLLEIDHYYYNEIYTFETARGTHLTLHNREDFESVEYISDIISDIEAEIYDKTTDYYERLLDMDSWVRYFWVQELSRNNDTMIGSSYMYYIVDENKLYAGPIWDMDNTLGIWGSGINLMTDGDHCRLFKWYEALLKHPNFTEAVQDAYLNGGIRELFELLPDRIDEYAAYIQTSAHMNYIVNEKNHYVPLKTVTYEDEVEYLKEFLTARLAWIEAKYAGA